MVISELQTHLTFNGLSVMYHVAKALGSGKSLEELLHEILEILDIHAGLSRGAISILNPENTRVVTEAARGLSREEAHRGNYRLGEGITGKVVESGKAIAVPRVSDEPQFLDRTGVRRHLLETPISFLCVPIKAGDDIVGAFSVDRTGPIEEDVLDNELRFLEAVADLIAQDIKERRKHQLKIAALEKENLELRHTLEERGKPDDVIGNSSSMRATYRLIAQVAPSSTSVLIRGETGTGKELIARAIHEKSAQKTGPFIAVNCAALPESLLESELFGHEKGSFTGATGKRIGRFEAANNGTLFLDEIGEMSLSAQSRLLRAIQEKEFLRVGGTTPVRIDVRLITATNRNLEEEVEAGRFREDLYYRINVFVLALPPLRERGADILLLADYFTKKYTSLHNKKVTRISTPAIDMISAYHWPGNVRELENVIERAVIVAVNDTIEGHDLPPTLQMKDAVSAAGRKDTFEGLVASYEKEIIVDALKDTRGNQTEAARLLGTTKRVIQYKVNKHGINYQRFRK